MTIIFLFLFDLIQFLTNTFRKIYVGSQYQSKMYRFCVIFLQPLKGWHLGWIATIYTLCMVVTIIVFWLSLGELQNRRACAKGHETMLEGGKSFELPWSYYIWNLVDFSIVILRKHFGNNDMSWSAVCSCRILYWKTVLTLSNWVHLSNLYVVPNGTRIESK